MRTRAIVYADTKTPMAQREWGERRQRFFDALLARIPDRATMNDAFVKIDAAAEPDYEQIEAASSLAGVDYNVVLEDKYSESELRRAKLIRLRIEGEPIDIDGEGHGLNAYRDLLCEACCMPNELTLPVPYRIAPGVRVGELSGSVSKSTELAAGVCGVLFVSDRIWNVLQCVAPEAFAVVPTEVVDGSKSVLAWAVRPRSEWGMGSCGPLLRSVNCVGGRLRQEWAMRKI